MVAYPDLTLLGREIEKSMRKQITYPIRDIEISTIQTERE